MAEKKGRVRRGVHRMDSQDATRTGLDAATLERALVDLSLIHI